MYEGDKSGGEDDQRRHTFPVVISEKMVVGNKNTEDSSLPAWWSQFVFFRSCFLKYGDCWIHKASIKAEHQLAINGGISSQPRAPTMLSALNCHCAVAMKLYFCLRVDSCSMGAFSSIFIPVTHVNYSAVEWSFYFILTIEFSLKSSCKHCKNTPCKRQKVCLYIKVTSTYRCWP